MRGEIREECIGVLGGERAEVVRSLLGSGECGLVLTQLVQMEAQRSQAHHEVEAELVGVGSRERAEVVHGLLCGGEKRVESSDGRYEPFSPKEY